MSVASFVLFAVVMLAVLAGINAQVFRWARNAFGLGARAQRLLTTLLWVSIAGTVLGRVAGRFWPGSAVTAVIAVSSTVQLAAIISGILLMVVDAVRLLSTIPGRFRKTRAVIASEPGQAPAVAAAPPEVPRRAFLAQAAAGSAFLIGGSSSLYGALKGRHDYALEEVNIRLPGLRGLDGFNIVQLSDVHIGAFTGASELAAAEELLRRAKPDLIVLTGDLLDNDARLAEVLGRFVRRLTPFARAGVVAIAGNHDHFAGVSETTAAVRAAGARMLHNDALVIGDAKAGFSLLGVDDVWARRQGGGPDLERALAALPKLSGRVAPAVDLPRVLLCHNPSFFAEAAGRVGLQLSGHTHGGQVNLGVRPADFLLPGGWVAGRYDLRGSALYVNRGFGTVGPPARIGAPPEVTRIVLSG
jgi:uncharacterized protein